MCLRVLILAMLAATTGCTTVATDTLPSVATVEYRLAKGDKLKLNVFREDTLSGDYVIDDQGIIVLPMVGDVVAGGKTLGQLRQELTATLSSEYVRNAKVNLDIISYRPVYVLGEVQRPGEYEFKEGMTVMAIVAKAGGFTYRANDKVVHIRHVDDAAEKAYQLTSGGSVLPGDTIRIEARYF